MQARGGVVLGDDMVRKVLKVQEPSLMRAARRRLLVHMSNLHKKLGPCRGLLQNKKGVGYLLAPLES